MPPHFLPFFDEVSPWVLCGFVFTICPIFFLTPQSHYTHVYLAHHDIRPKYPDLPYLPCLLSPIFNPKSQSYPSLSLWRIICWNQFIFQLLPPTQKVSQVTQLPLIQLLTSFQKRTICCCCTYCCCLIDLFSLLVIHSSSVSLILKTSEYIVLSIKWKLI